MASCYAHRQPSWRTALDDDDDNRLAVHQASAIDRHVGARSRLLSHFLTVASEPANSYTY